MQFTFFHLMPYRPLDMAERNKHKAAWVVLPNTLYDPKKGADEYESYINQLVYAEKLGFDVIAVNEDLGLQDRLTVSPAMWREFFKPRYQAVYARVHAHGLLVFQHSCGYIQDIIPDLAEIGVDILETQQLACMDMAAIAQQRVERRPQERVEAPFELRQPDRGVGDPVQQG